jgi:hypothetical protein
MVAVVVMLPSQFMVTLQSFDWESYMLEGKVGPIRPAFTQIFAQMCSNMSHADG